MPIRNGKLANLPNPLREQLNLRLLEGETGRELAAWLNALPEVQSILGAQFNGSPISEVNLTHWRQGGYLQWLTERECFDSARALAEGDCDLAKAGLSAERLFNILTLRYGELLTQWDISPDDSVSETAVFAEAAKKARILLRITRSVLAIHRIQSRSASSKAGPESSSFNSQTGTVAGPARAEANSMSHPGSKLAPETKVLSMVRAATSVELESGPNPFALRPILAPRGATGGRPKILSGPISPTSASLNLSQTPFNADVDFAEILKAVS